MIKKILVIMAIMLISSMSYAADNYFTCMQNGGTWSGNIMVGTCTYPSIEEPPATVFDQLQVPSEITITELLEPNLDMAYTTLGPAAENTVLSQDENFELTFVGDVEYNEPVNIQIFIGFRGNIDINPLFINENDQFTNCPSWYRYNKTQLPKQVFLPETSVSNIFNTYKGWIFIGTYIAPTNGCVYEIQYYWVWVSNPNID